MKRAILALCLLAGSVQAQTLPTPHYGGVTLEGSSSGGSTVAAPASGSTITITLPGTAGTSGQVLTHGAGDTLAWASAASVANALLLETVGTSQKISALSAFDLTAPPTGAEPLAVVQGGTTVRVTLAQLYTLFAGWLNFVATSPLDAPGGSGNAGQEVFFQGGSGDGVGAGGGINVLGGDAPDIGAGGQAVISGGSSANGTGGDTLIKAGTGGTSAGNVLLPDLPTSDPGVSTALWSNRGVLELSGNTPALAHTDVAQSFTKAQRGTPVTLSLSGATATPNYDNGQNFALTLVHASCPCTLANPSTTPVAGQAGQIVVTQSATGSDTLAFGNEFKFAGGVAPTLSTGANAVDVLSYFVVSPTFIVVTALLDFQ